MSELQIAQLSRGHFFGESALHENKPRNANVVAKTTVECYVISSRLFNKHLSSLSNDIKDRTSRNMQYREEKLKQYYTGSHFESGMSMKDVEIVGFLGKGIVGQVVLVRTKVGEHYYAVKCINKSFVVKNEMAADVVAEMKLLKSLRSPFLSHMLFSDRDPEYVFMGFNMLPGGNLYARLRRHGPMSEEQCRFYVAGIINALDFLHQRNIAHRDVKPENIVLDRYGYPVLIDFGCARSILKQSMTICGTPLYVAPEGTPTRPGPARPAGGIPKKGGCAGAEPHPGGAIDAGATDRPRDDAPARAPSAHVQGPHHRGGLLVLRRARVRAAHHVDALQDEPGRDGARAGVAARSPPAAGRSTHTSVGRG